MKVSSHSANSEARICCEEDNGSFSLKPGDADYAKDTLYLLFPPVVSENITSIAMYTHGDYHKFIGSCPRVQCWKLEDFLEPIQLWRHSRGDRKRSEAQVHLFRY